MDKEDHGRLDGGKEQRKGSYTTQEVSILSLIDRLPEFIKGKNYRHSYHVCRSQQKIR